MVWPSVPLITAHGGVAERTGSNVGVLLFEWDRPGGDLEPSVRFFTKDGY